MGLQEDELVAPSCGQQSSVRCNGEFVRANFKLADNSAGGKVDLYNIKFVVEGNAFGVDGSIEFTGRGESSGVELSAVFPLPAVLSALAKPLEAPVLAVGDVKVFVRTDGDRMNHVKFARTCSVLPPLSYFLSQCVILNYSRIAIAVRDEYVTILCEGNVGCAAKVFGLIRYVSNADFEKLFSFRRKLENH